MNCNEFKDLVVVGIYGKLTEREKAEFDGHRSGCERCEALYKSTGEFSRIYDDKNDVPLPDWDESWNVISNEVFRKKRFSFSFAPGMRFAAAAAAVVVVFAVGLFAGRHLFDRTGPDTAQHQVLPIRHYAENLEPLLVNFTNRGAEQTAEEYSEVELRILSDMLTQTRLLKYMAEQRGDDSQIKLLEDLEFVLMDITNLRPGEQEPVEQLKRLIKEKDLRYRLKNFAEENPFI